MDYFRFSSELKKNKLYVFSLRDAENLFPKEKLKTLKNNLSRWIKANRLVKLKRSIYQLTEPGLELNFSDFYIANKLYAPSYISLETALSLYGFIPEVAAQVTSITTKSTRQFSNKYGVFYYRSCQKKAFTGYKLMAYEGTKIYIASAEKALVDFIYFAVRKSPLDFEQERFNQEKIKKLRWRKAIEYAKLYNRKTLATLSALKEWAKC